MISSKLTESSQTSTDIVLPKNGIKVIHQEVGYLQLQQSYNELINRHEDMKLELIGYKQQANFWKAQHERAANRASQLRQIIKALIAKVRLRERQLFGKKSEKSKKGSESISQEVEQKKPRGQQKGTKGHGRRSHNHLPMIEEILELPKDQRYCLICGLPFEELPGTEDSELIEIVDVKAHRRKIRRKIYKKRCKCKNRKQASIITSPPAPRVIPKSKIGISLWTKILLEKYHYQRPLYRLLKFLAKQGLSLPQGTITGGLKNILNIFVPIYDALQKKSLKEKHWHADESRWEVFQEIEGKAGHRWYLWVFRSVSSVVFKLDPSRSAKAPKNFFKNIAKGILSVDRYVVYKVIAKAGLLILAFCWVHVRRDFLSHAKCNPKEEQWGMDWVERINGLYHINNERVKHEKTSKEFTEKDTELRNALNGMRKKYKEQLQDTTLLTTQIKLLESLDNHWNGLIVFVDHPEIPMDNNIAERTLRNGILGRKSYYGSGSLWSGFLTVMLFSIFQTLELWGINQHTWLAEYLNACANNHGQAPKNISRFLPWEMSKRRKQLLALPPNYKDTS